MTGCRARRFVMRCSTIHAEGGWRLISGIVLRQGCGVLAAVVLTLAAANDAAGAPPVGAPEPLVRAAAPAVLAAGLTGYLPLGIVEEREVAETVMPILVADTAGVSALSPAADGTWHANGVVRFGAGVDPVGVVGYQR